MKSKNIYSESNKEELTWLLCQNRDSLLYLANLGCIEMNVWNSRASKLDYPDYMVIDLDPDGNAFAEVVALARQTRKLFLEFGIESYCKTSGQSGLHVYVPLGARYTHEQARQFAKSVPVTGLVLTKLDGTAKGGIVVAIAKELGIPIRYVGIGEQMSDLVEFSTEAYINGLFD